MTDTFERLKAALADGYAIERELGAGGMATVYLAEDVRHERPVALKVLRPELAHALGPERFLREIKITARLTHPNILPLLDSGEADGFLFYVMPFVEGESLRDRLDREKQLPIDDAVRIAREISDALAYAHDHDVLHRDIKPENVLLESGHAVVADFGIARAINAAGGENLTETGLAIGTPSYMSPEQAAGEKDLDGRSDLYSLGCLLFEMLAGQPPFTGPRVETVIQQHLIVEAPAITNWRPAVSAEVVAAMARALAKTPADRFSSLGQFADALGQRESATAATATTPTTVKLSSNRARSVMIALAIYVGASWVVLEVADQIVARYLLPGWVYPAALILLLLGFPIVLATAFVRQEGRLAPEHAGKPIVRHLTWPRAMLGGALAFAALGVMSTLIVASGFARVTEARGMAGEAFEERAWIVMAEFDASESEREIALAAQTALSIDLQQSQYVNVRGRNQIVPVLRLMGLPDTTHLDEAIALEIAQREGMAVVLVPAVVRLGDDYLFSARVIQPGSGEEIIAVRTAARAERLLEGVEALSRELRSRLGEASAAIRQSRPLPDVTTSSLEALRKYALAEAALSVDRDFLRAAELAVEATRLDTSFAMAHRLAGVAYGNAERRFQGLEYAQMAYERRDRLTDRERMHVEGTYYQQRLEVRRAAEVYKALLAQYPDDLRALNNLAVAIDYLGETERGYEAYLKGVALDPYSGLRYGNAIYAAITVERWGVADSLIAAARTAGFETVASRYSLFYSVGRGDFDRGDALCDSVLAEAGSPAVLADRRSFCGSLSAARGRVRQAIRRLEASERPYGEQLQLLDYSNAVLGVAMAEQMRGRPTAARARLAAALDRFEPDSVREFERVVYRTTLGVGAALLGHPDLLERFAETFPEPSGTIPWAVEYAESMMSAARSLAGGEAEAAVAALRGIDAAGYVLSGWIPHAQLMYGLAFEELAELDSAVAHFELALQPRVMTESGSWGFARMQLPFVLRSLAELETVRGDTAAAIERYQQFLDLWKDADPELQPTVRDVRQRLAKLVGER